MFIFCSHGYISGKYFGYYVYAESICIKHIVLRRQPFYFQGMKSKGLKKILNLSPTCWGKQNCIGRTYEEKLHCL